MSPDRPFQALIAALDPNHDLGDRQHVLQVHQDAGHTLPLGALKNATQEGRLSVPTRPDQSKRVATFGQGEKIFRLRIPIDHVLGREWAREAKRIQVPDWRHASQPSTVA